MKQYKPLYLKYRPQKLSELVGQEVVFKTLSNAINYNRIVHAYLFCGPRGTGKTSSARILAKSLNCEKGTSTDPCGECVSCRSITNGNSLDVVEIDAASHRKVEDAEDLINRVNLGTYGSRFKIYIIDEVHMLTDHAFNALLKTIEEPPKNVIFILATTEEYKVLPTIISRCQKLDFKAVAKEDLTKRISDIAKVEKINIDQTIITFIANRSLGCLRDAISLLDQISVLQDGDKQINSKEVFELFGTVDRKELFKLIHAVLLFERSRAIEYAENLIKSGKDIGELFKSLLELIIDLTKAKISTDFKKSLSEELSDKLIFLNNISQNHLLKIIGRLQDSQPRLRFALSQELQFMVEIMSMMDEDFLISVTALKERIEKLEPMSPQADEPKNQQTGEPTSLQANKPMSLQTNEPKVESASLDTLWKQIVGLIESNPTKTLLNQSESYLINLTDEIVEIGLSKDMFLPRLDQDTKKKEMILKAVESATSFHPAVVRFKVLARQKTEETEKPVFQNEPTSPRAKDSHSPQKSEPTTDEFSNAVSELLGAKPVN